MDTGSVDLALKHVKRLLSLVMAMFFGRTAITKNESLGWAVSVPAASLFVVLFSHHGVIFAPVFGDNCQPFRLDALSFVGVAEQLMRATEGT